MKVEFVQIVGCDGDIVYNLECVLVVIVDCVVDIELVVFLEIYLIGFFSEDNIVVFVELFDGLMVSVVQCVVCECNVLVVIGIVEVDVGCYYNIILLIVFDGIVLKYCKIYLWVFDCGIFMFGDCYVIVLWNGIWVGLLVCFDIEFLESVWVFG